MKVWINTALLTFLITEHIYSYDNVFFNIFLRTRNLQCVFPLLLENYNCFTIVQFVRKGDECIKLHVL